MSADLPTKTTLYMAEIRVGNTRIPVSGMVQKLRTGLFTPELLGEYSFPFTVANTPEIAQALGLPADPQSATDFGLSVPADLFVRGNRRYRGKVDILEADHPTQIKLVFVLASGFFIQENANLKLSQCYGPDDVIILDPDVEYIGGYRIRCAHGNARLTLNGAVFDMAKDDFVDQEDQLYAMAEWIESLIFLHLKTKVVISKEGHSSSSYLEFWDGPVPTVASLVQMPNGGINRSYIATARQAPRFLMGAYNTANDANRIAFPQFYNPGLYEGQNPIFDGIVNRYDDLGRMDVYNPSYFAFSDALQWNNTVIPFLYLTDVVKQLFTHLGIAVSGEFFDDPMVRRLLLYNNRTLDFLDIKQGAVSQRRTAMNADNGDFTEQENLIYQNVFNFNIKLANHVPPVSVLEFLKALKNTLFLKYDFNLLQNRVDIRFVRNVIRSREVIDLSPMAERGYTLFHGKETGLKFVYEHKDPVLEKGQNPVPVPQHTVLRYTDLDELDAELDDYAYVQSLSATFRLIKEREDPARWELHAFDLQDDPDREEAVDWPMGITPLADAYYDGKKIPSIEGAAYAPDANLYTADPSLRITAFYGQRTDTQDRPYAYASSNRFDADGSYDESMYSLNVRSADLTPLWQDLNRILTKPMRYRGNVMLSEADLQLFARTRLIRIRNVLYLLDVKELTITDAPHALAKIDLYKLKSS